MASIEYHHGNLRETLILAGENELSRLGPEALSLREIAKRAGVSHNAPYRHFKSKDELVQQIIEKSLLELAEQILSAPLFYPASILMQVQYVGRLWALLAIRQPHKARLIFTNSDSHLPNQHNCSTHYQLVHSNLKSILDAACGSEIHSETNCATLALILIASFNGIALLHTSTIRDQLIHTPEHLYDLTDEVTQNILHSKIA